MNISTNSPIKSSQAISLRQIASWDPDTKVGVESEVRASVPALQRGLVWRPHQIEMLWDSVLRGFPIGALVVCQKIDSQERGADDRITHHLLDGQQRCNAIALGFTDAFPVESANAEALRKTSILWLDLEPVRDANSTRNYLVRVTTLAHPWGYLRSDAAGPLSIGDIRASLKPLRLDPAQPDYRRPLPRDLQPYQAKTPIPLAWLLLAPLETREAFWQHVSQRASAGTALNWTDAVRRFLNDCSPAAEEQKDSIYRAVTRAHLTEIIALNAPQELLEVSQQEKQAEETRADISNVEHLFQRLNQLGTRLDGEELAYSLIKAYWPQLANPIDRIARGRMPQARMVTIAVRAALAQNKEERLPGTLGVSAVRAIARGRGERKQIIYDFIEKRLEGTCDLVDRWLRYDTATNRTGLLPVHITSIALNSPDVYLLLLCFADRLLATGGGDRSFPEWAKPMRALGTLLHWFSADKGATTNRVFAKCSQEMSLARVREALGEATQAGELCPMHTSEAVELFTRMPVGDLGDWQWWSLIDRGDGEEGRALRQRQWWGFLEFRENRELLLYTQRHFVTRRFPDYDPARKEFWDLHNRPWDFDHILASSYLYYGRGPFKGVCDRWAGTIANLRAWPFEDNRSDQAQPASAKIGSDAGRLADSFLTAEEESVFSLAESIQWEEAASRRFIEVCRMRLIRIYQEWYESLRIAEMVQPTIPPPPKQTIGGPATSELNE